MTCPACDTPYPEDQPCQLISLLGVEVASYAVMVVTCPACGHTAHVPLKRKAKR